MSIIVREARLEDAEGIIDVLNPIIKTKLYTALLTPFSIEDERRFILNFPAQGIFYVAVHDRKIVGLQNVEPFATYTPAFDHVGVIGTYVHLEHQRQGIGKALFQATFEAARSKGYEKLFAYVRSDNATGLATYLSQGFNQIGIARKHAKINGVYQVNA